MDKFIKIIKDISSILLLVNGVVWLIIGIVIIFAIVRVGTSGVEQVIGGTVGTQQQQSNQSNMQPQNQQGGGVQQQMQPSQVIPSNQQNVYPS